MENEAASAGGWELERQDVLTRAGRSRQALVDAVSRLSADAFLREPRPQWGAARILRHVVWVEHFWTLLLREVRQSDEQTVDVTAGNLRGERAGEASRLAGTPPEPLPEPPPFAAKDEALDALAASRAEYERAVSSLRPEDLQRRLSHPERGVMPLRFAVEHVIEHDWDHAVQIASLPSH